MAHILLVEDDLDIQATVRDLLEEEGYEVIVANNGIEAMTALRDAIRPSVILLDLMMPVMDGWRTLDALRSDARLAQIPVVVTSAVPDEAVAAKATIVVPKPYTRELLLDAVNVLTRAVRSEDRAAG